MNIKVGWIKMASKKGRRKTIKYVLKNCIIKGKKHTVPRDKEASVTVYLYYPAQGGENLPVIFNVHGGAWLGGDAILLDTQSQNMANRLGAMVVNINYIKADIKPFPYAQYEVRDTVHYFLEHSKEYSLDTEKFVLMGYSAGGHLCACATQLLKAEGIRISCQVLCYPFLDFTYGQENSNDAEKEVETENVFKQILFPNMSRRDSLVSPGILPDEQLVGIAPAIIITCGQDALKPQADAYAKRLEKVKVPVQLLNYPDAIHGFLECNYPETDDENGAKSPEQEILCHKCENEIAEKLLEMWGL
ncbi:MAG: alpha/beta hydrolase fold domain-containing protein [Agathobacter sp.]|nr:alpha/beta hydrolase fold domain-containing protein [Agathobacter sp.]